MIFRTGDNVTATYEGRTVRAVVLLASGNGRSLMLGWDGGMLGGHCGMMPVTQIDDGSYESLIEHKPITLRLLQ